MARKSFSQRNTKMPLAIREAENSQRPELQESKSPGIKY